MGVAMMMKGGSRVGLGPEQVSSQKRYAGQQGRGEWMTTWTGYGVMWTLNAEVPPGVQSVV